MKYLLLDVAGTLLHKPDLFLTINNTLQNFGHTIALDKLRYNHKMLSETIKFPDRTDVDFYSYFNSEFLYSLGIIPNAELLNAVFQSCSYLPWEKFEDTNVLKEIEIPIGIISNFNSSLKKKMNDYFGSIFSDFFVSEELGISKPSLEFYQKAIEKIKIEPKDILYVGDSFKLDLEPAVRLGINTLIVDRDNFYPNNPNTILSLLELKNKIQL
ncbi:HAD family hydrolase [Flavobacterium artemisiae]|uniref:HAD family hydrolase n=1 Tax=Flavobacterium artemisiae TaxID=2126556 RepID=A0ABW4H892_9FLAO